MGQIEVLTYLLEQRKKSDKWFSAKMISTALRSRGFSEGYLTGINGDLMKLASFNIIEFRGIGIWEHHKEYRALIEPNNGIDCAQISRK